MCGNLCVDKYGDGNVSRSQIRYPFGYQANPLYSPPPPSYIYIYETLPILALLQLADESLLLQSLW
jgi:hypothetical protein